jgi:peptidoglycan hydrolase CwlO-like protein
MEKWTWPDHDRLQGEKATLQDKIDKKTEELGKLKGEMESLDLKIAHCKKELGLE